MAQVVGSKARAMDGYDILGKTRLMSIWAWDLFGWDLSLNMHFERWSWQGFSARVFSNDLGIVVCMDVRVYRNE